MTEAELIEVVRVLQPLLRATRDETERKRRLSPQLVEALAAANLFRLSVPRADAGLEAAPSSMLRVLEELAAVDAATAWIVWVNTLPALISRFLSAQVRAALFAGPAHIMASSTRPTGQALRERDGIRVTGRWALVSGCELADHFLLRVAIAPPTCADAGQRELTTVFLKRADCAIVDTWYAGGLRGTGSHDVVVDGVWAPRSHCVYFDQPAQLTSPLYRMPFVAMLAAGCASVCLGIARAALQTLLDIAQTKPLVDRATWLRDQPHLLVEIPRLQAVLSGARLVLAETVTSAWRSCESSEPVSSIRRAAMLAAAQHAASNAKHIVRTCYELAGSNALYESCPIERAHRDIHAALQHVIMQKMWLEDAGRAVLGVTPLSPLFHV